MSFLSWSDENLVYIQSVQMINARQKVEWNNEKSWGFEKTDGENQ